MSAEPTPTDPGTAMSGAAPTEPTAIQTTPAAPTDWRSGMEADYRDNPSISKFQSINDLAKGYLSAESFIGAEKVALPKDDWADADWNSFYTKLGRPESPDDYELGDFSAPESWGEEFQKELVGTLHKRGANSDMVKDVLGLVAGRERQSSEAFAQEAAQLTESGIKELRSAWGKSFDSNVAVAMRAFHAAAGGSEAANEIAELELKNGVKLGDFPPMMRAWANIGNKMSEHGLVGDKATQRTTFSPEEATQQIATLRGDENFMKAYTDAQHPEHTMALNRMNALFEAQYATEGE